MVIHHPASQRPPHPTAWGTATGTYGEGGGGSNNGGERGETARVKSGGLWRGERGKRGVVWMWENKESEEPGRAESEGREMWI